MSSGGGKNKPMKKMAHVGPNMTPMVDVVMCILIFFMLGSTFLQTEMFLQSSMPAIDKAGLGTEQANQKLPPVRLNIVLKRRQENGADKPDTFVVAFGSQPMRMNLEADTDKTNNQQIEELFLSKKDSLSSDVQLIIQPDKYVPYQDVITVYDYCVKAKFEHVAFAPANEKS